MHTFQLHTGLHVYISFSVSPDGCTRTFQWFMQLCEVLDEGIVIVLPDPSLNALTIRLLQCGGATNLNHGGERVWEGEREGGRRGCRHVVPRILRIGIFQRVGNRLCNAELEFACLSG